MAKVKCNVCANETSGFCKVKKIGVRPNKSRICEAYTYDEAKLKTKQSIPTSRVGYSQQQEAKRRMKAELKRIKEELKRGPKQGTAQDLGLIKPVEHKGIIMPGDAGFSMPRDPKHPLTGDLSRFTTTATEKE
jgi:hypothetical protein